MNRTRQFTQTTDNTSGNLWHVLELPEGQPTPYDIAFCNESARKELQAYLTVLQKTWADLTIQQIEPPYDESIPANAQRLAKARQAMFIDPQNAEFINEAASKLMNYYYWVAGSYIITLEVGIEGISHTFPHRWKIAVTPEMERKLKENARRVVAGFCQQPPTIVGQYFSAWPPFEEV